MRSLLSQTLNQLFLVAFDPAKIKSCVFSRLLEGVACLTGFVAILEGGSIATKRGLSHRIAGRRETRRKMNHACYSDFQDMEIGLNVFCSENRTKLSRHHYLFHKEILPEHCKQDVSFRGR